MTHLVYNFLFWVFYSALIVCGSSEMIAQQTFLKPHVEETVTQTEHVRLKEIDVFNPTFIFK